MSSIYDLLEWENFIDIVHKLKNIEDPEIVKAREKILKRERRDKYLIVATLKVVKYLISKKIAIEEKIVEREVKKERIIERKISITEAYAPIVEGKMILHPKPLWYTWKLLRSYNELIFSIRYNVDKKRQETLLDCFISILEQIAARLKILKTEEKQTIIREVKKYMRTPSNRLLAVINDHVREVVYRILMMPLKEKEARK